MAEVHRLATTYPNQVVAIGETGMDLFRTGEGAKELQREAFRAHVALAKELNLPMQIHDRDSHKEVIETLLADGAPNVPCSTATPATPKWAKSPRKRLVSQPFRHIQLQRQRRNPRIGQTRRHEPRHGRNRCPLS